MYVKRIALINTRVLTSVSDQFSFNKKIGSSSQGKVAVIFVSLRLIISRELYIYVCGVITRVLKDKPNMAETDVQFQSLSIALALPTPQAPFASWEGHDLARTCGILYKKWRLRHVSK